jgi:hypothetical protein
MTKSSSSSSNTGKGSNDAAVKSEFLEKAGKKVEAATKHNNRSSFVMAAPSPKNSKGSAVSNVVLLVVTVGGEKLAIFLFNQIFGAGIDLRNPEQWFGIRGICWVAHNMCWLTLSACCRTVVFPCGITGCAGVSTCIRRRLSFSQHRVQWSSSAFPRFFLQYCSRARPGVPL